MIAGTVWKLLPLLFGLMGAGPGVISQSVTRLMVQVEMIMRVPLQPRPLFREIEWVEHKGPKCVPLGAIRGALLSQRSQVDFILANHVRVRAQLDEDCPALDFYGGVYIQPRDERLCAKRDAVTSRIGGSCTIERFRQLEPKVKQ